MRIVEYMKKTLKVKNAFNQIKLYREYIQGE